MIISHVKKLWINFNLLILTREFKSVYSLFREREKNDQKDISMPDYGIFNTRLWAG